MGLDGLEVTQGRNGTNFPSRRTYVTSIMLQAGGTCITCHAQRTARKWHARQITPLTPAVATWVQL